MVDCESYVENMWKKGTCRDCKRSQAEHAGGAAVPAPAVIPARAPVSSQMKAAAPASTPAASPSKWSAPAASPAKLSTPAASPAKWSAPAPSPAKTFAAPSPSWVSKPAPAPPAESKAAAPVPTSTPVAATPVAVKSNAFGSAGASSVGVSSGSSSGACSAFSEHAFKPGKCKTCFLSKSAHSGGTGEDAGSSAAAAPKPLEPKQPVVSAVQKPAAAPVSQPAASPTPAAVAASAAQPAPAVAASIAPVATAPASTPADSLQRTEPGTPLDAPVMPPPKLFVAPSPSSAAAPASTPAKFVAPSPAAPKPAVAPSPQAAAPITASPAVVAKPASSPVSAPSASPTNSCAKFVPHAFKKDCCRECGKATATHSNGAVAAAPAAAPASFRAPVPVQRAPAPVTAPAASSRPFVSVHTPKTPSVHLSQPGTPNTSTPTSMSKSPAKAKVNCVLFVPGAFVKAVCATCSRAEHEHMDEVVRRSREGSISGSTPASATNSRKNSIAGSMYGVVVGDRSRSASISAAPGQINAQAMPAVSQAADKPASSPLSAPKAEPATSPKAEAASAPVVTPSTAAAQSPTPVAASTPSASDASASLDASSESLPSTTPPMLNQSSRKVSGGIAERMRQMSIGSGIAISAAHMMPGGRPPSRSTSQSGLLSGSDHYSPDAPRVGIMGNSTSPPVVSNTNADGSPVTEVMDVDPLSGGVARGSVSSFSRPAVRRGTANSAKSAPRFNALPQTVVSPPPIVTVAEEHASHEAEPAAEAPITTPAPAAAAPTTPPAASPAAAAESAAPTSAAAAYAAVAASTEAPAPRKFVAPVAAKTVVDHPLAYSAAPVVAEAEVEPEPEPVSEPVKKSEPEPEPVVDSPPRVTSPKPEPQAPVPEDSPAPVVSPVAVSAPSAVFLASQHPEPVRDPASLFFKPQTQVVPEPAAVVPVVPKKATSLFGDEEDDLFGPPSVKEPSSAAQGPAPVPVNPAPIPSPAAAKVVPKEDAPRPSEVTKVAHTPVASPPAPKTTVFFSPPSAVASTASPKAPAPAPPAPAPPAPVVSPLVVPPVVQPAAAPPKSSLFGDDDDLFGTPSVVAPASLKSLADDSDDKGTTNKVVTPVVAATVKKPSLFGDDDDDLWK